MKVILASSSPRRHELLKQIGLEYAACAPDDESEGSAEFTPPLLHSSVIKDRKKKEARMVVEKNALQKARAVSSRANGNELVIGADTIVLLDNEILGKPAHGEEARRMLEKLSGKTHFVVTGVSVIERASGRELVSSEVTEVTFRKLSESEIEGYVRSGEPLDKAGAYGIQGLGALLVKSIRGCYFNVVGLPLVCLSELLKDAGLRLM